MSDFADVQRRNAARISFVRTLLLTCGLAAGCSPAIKFTRTECLYIPERDGPGSVAFVSTFEARNLTNEQLVYQVTLERSGDRPVRAPGTQFRDKEGRVAANRSLMCLTSPWTFENTRVAIPVGQLGVTSDDRSVTAVFAVNRADGTNLATDRLPLPLARVHRAMGNPTSPPRASSRGARPARPKRPAKSSPETTPRRPTRPPAEATPPAEAEPTEKRSARSEPPSTNDPPIAARQAEPREESASEAKAVREAEPPRNSAASDPTGRTSNSGDVVEKKSQLRYVVRRGDTLSEIAKQTLGESAQWPAILEANRDQISAPEDLREGMELIIPEGPQ